MIKLFITATDTDAGKTYVATALTTALVNHQKKVAVFKPISAGCEKQIINNEEVLVNVDADLLMKAANCQQRLQEINPIAFEEPIAPHIAAQKQSQAITLASLNDYYGAVCKNSADIIITEGAGGWRLPLGNSEYLSSFVKATQQKVILVVNMKLGCLNHAVLTYESILSDGLNCIGWVANCQQDMPYQKENIAELQTLLKVPLIATFKNEKNINIAADQFSIDTFLNTL